MKNLTYRQTPMRMTYRPKKPSLRFTPTAWAKLLFLRDYGETEVAGFGIADTDDLLLVTDIALVEQTCTVVTFAFKDDAVADFFDEQVDRGLKPAQFGRIWIHTHPGKCPQPSSTDEETFARVFGSADWAAMFILACGGATYARLQFSAGPGGFLQIPVRVDYIQPFEASDQAAWELEYLAKVTPATWDDHKFAGNHALPLFEASEPFLAGSSEVIDPTDPFHGEEYWYGW